jgi:AcrR family transcriptional regulator
MPLAMDVVNPAPPSRKERARATRLRMLRAARHLFIERGYAGARMVDIAEQAGVAVQTLYFTFHTKPELLQACYELAVLGEADPTPPPEQPWYTAALASRTGPGALRHFAEGAAAVVARVAVLDDVVRSARHEPEATRVREHNERLRREGYRAIVEHVAKRFGLRAGLNIDTGTDLLMTLAGPATYRPLVVEYGWSHEEYVAWLAATLTNQLLSAKKTNLAT